MTATKSTIALSLLLLFNALPTILAVPGPSPLSIRSSPLTAREDPLHIPLTRRKRSIPSHERNWSDVADRMRFRYGYGPISETRRKSKRAGVANIQTTNQDADSSYFASADVGTPAQSFAFVLDTGSSDLWLSATDCEGCPANTPRFNPSSSSSFQASVTAQPIELDYGSGEAKGTLGQDVVSMGGFVAQNQAFTLVTEVSQGLLDGDTTGIMGLAFESIAASEETPLWQNLVSQFSAPQFSFWLTRFDNDPNIVNPTTGVASNENGGAITLGGTNGTLFTGSIDSRPFPQGSTVGFWLQEVTGATVSGNSVSVPTGSAGFAAIDTGTTLIGGPTAAVQAIYAQIPGSQAMTGDMEGFYEFSCSQKINFTMSFGGPFWPVSDADFAIPNSADGSTCLGGVFDLTAGANVPPNSNTPGWVVGDTFLKNVYSVFSATSTPTVGFAALSSAAGGSGSGSTSGSSSSSSSGSSSSGTPTSISSSISFHIPSFSPLPFSPIPLPSPSSSSPSPSSSLFLSFGSSGGGTTTTATGIPGSTTPSSSGGGAGAPGSGSGSSNSGALPRYEVGLVTIFAVIVSMCGMLW